MFLSGSKYILCEDSKELIENQPIIKFNFLFLFAYSSASEIVKKKSLLCAMGLILEGSYITKVKK